MSCSGLGKSSKARQKPPGNGIESLYRSIPVTTIHVSISEDLSKKVGKREPSAALCSPKSVK